MKEFGSNDFENKDTSDLSDFKTVGVGKKQKRDSDTNKKQLTTSMQKNSMHSSMPTDDGTRSRPVHSSTKSVENISKFQTPLTSSVSFEQNTRKEQKKPPKKVSKQPTQVPINPTDDSSSETESIETDEDISVSDYSEDILECNIHENLEEMSSDEGTQLPSTPEKPMEQTLPPGSYFLTPTKNRLCH